MPANEHSIDRAVEVMREFFSFLIKPTAGRNQLTDFGKRTVCVSWLLGVSYFSGMTKEELCKRYWISPRKFSLFCNDFKKQFGDTLGKVEV